MTDARFTLEQDLSEQAVRSVLSTMRAWLAGQGAGETLCGTVELVLAEALNNIVEHAYAPIGRGPLSLESEWRGDRLHVVLRDGGRALPGLALPDARLPDADGALDDLPEGGFDWFLIHDLTDSLHYARVGDENRLELVFGNNPQGK